MLVVQLSVILQLHYHSILLLLKLTVQITLFLYGLLLNYSGTSISAATNTNVASYSGYHLTVHGNQINLGAFDTSYTWTWEAWQ
ncbi:hypothetical protein [Clostridium saccharoperbutylacetonicum]|uniref:hypothetical protein n=1 Tax=Clostridium saccharoperbutylacetonicum TaxID=36745 RepID=UPI000983DE11|nr:hypothetical protein [Clostridium saccharoperbutylacetonicum]AQR95202.1 hypothetical protein CLSAP_25180 [Clostridium saccharoperbutylacetonicum]NSB31056.1 hypothetical protein [Clostridium saccharoperbutylacetonicum]